MGDCSRLGGDLFESGSDFSQESNVDSFDSGRVTVPRGSQHVIHFLILGLETRE